MLMLMVSAFPPIWDENENGNHKNWLWVGVFEEPPLVTAW